jgi:hypothetical protein
MDIVLGISMAPAAVQMVLLQGENADGTTVDENEFAVTADDDSPTVGASDRVIAAIVATREDAASAGLELSAVGVACTDQLEAATLRDALTAHKMENVMLVSAFLAATALTQSVGGAMGYERTAVLFVEPDTATLAIVETSDGSIADVRQESTAELTKLVAGLDELPTRPGGLFLVGCGVDIATIKPLLEEATSLTVSAPEEPETALARGAALASANAPLFASSTAALAYERDPGTGALDASAPPEYLSIADAEPGEDGLAYSAATDDEANVPTVVIEGKPRRRPVLLVGTALAVAAISALVALEIALTLGIHTTVGLLPAPLRNILAPAQQAPAPAAGQVAATKVVAPKPLNPPAAAPSPAAPLPAAPVPAAAPIPAAPLPAAPVPAAPVPAAPDVPVPVVIPPMAPAPVPPVHLPHPPVVQAPPPPVEPPPIHIPPPHLPPPHEPHPGQGPWPNPAGGGPVKGPGPSHGTPGGGPPEGGTPPGAGAPPDHGGPVGGGGPVSGPGPSHGTPGGGPPEGGTPPGAGAPPDHGGPLEHGGPVSGGETPGGGAPLEHGGPVSGGETPSGGAPTGGSESSSGGAPTGGSESSSGGAPTGGSESSGGGASSGAGESGGHR